MVQDPFKMLKTSAPRPSARIPGVYTQVAITLLKIWSGALKLWGKVKDTSISLSLEEFIE